MTEFEQRVIEIDSRSKSNTKRIDKLENITEAIHETNKHIAELVVELKHLAISINDHEDRLSCIERKPSDTLKTISAAIITSIIGGTIGIFIGMLMKG